MTGVAGVNSKQQHIGVMGGMFDPVHNGHLNAALASCETFGLDHIRLIPCGRPVHRQATFASAEDRIAMLRLAVAGEESRLLVDERECRSQQASYMFNTLQSLHEENPAARLYLILGEDAFRHFPGWYRWQDIFQLAHLLVITRPGSEISGGGSSGDEADVTTFFARREVSDFTAMQAAEHGLILRYRFAPLEISSTQIRKLISEQRSVRFLLPDAVNDYIRTHHLYRGK